MIAQYHSKWLLASLQGHLEVWCFPIADIYLCICKNFETISFDADPGTKPGVRSQTLISTGISELDTILGGAIGAQPFTVANNSCQNIEVVLQSGGLPLGTVLLLLEDEYTQHHRTLLKYFLAEGLACGHQCHWAAAKHSPDGVGAALPQLVVPKPGVTICFILHI